jgi:predicted phosphoribosyltransferase
MTQESLNALLGLAATGIPAVANLFKAVMEFRKQYPQMSDAELIAVLSAMTGTNDTAADALISKIDADQASHPIV